MKARQITKKEFRIAAAYHEAGHAVAACRLGVRVRFATIVPDGDLGGAGQDRTGKAKYLGCC